MPHGESSPYETLVKLAQPWNNIQCSIEGFGNFGDSGGASAAASRYIESRLSYYAYKCFFEEFDPNIVDMKLNYLGDKYEPEYLPAKYPNVMINNTFGIGYGVSTSICTYNLKEVLELTLELMDNPDKEDIILYPDSPTGAYIVDEGQFGEISKTGKGKFKMRGVIEIDEENNVLDIYSTPLSAYWSTIKPNIFNLLNDGKTNMMKDYSNESDIDHFHHKIYLKKEVDPYAVMHMIYDKTQMEKTFPVNFKLIENYEDLDFNIKSILLTWIDFRRETKRRYYNHKLSKCMKRQHILEILLFILNKDNAEKTMTIIKKSENKKEIIKKLMSTYGITSLQADNIAEMKMSAFTKEARKRYEDEKDKIDKEVEKINKIVRSTKKIDKIIKEELEEGIKLFGEERRSKIINIDNEVKIRDTGHVMVFTKNGKVKKLPDDVTSVGKIASDDYPSEIIQCRNTDELLLFDRKGSITKLPIHSVRGTVVSSEGNKLTDYCTPTAPIVTIKTKPSLELLDSIKEPVYFLMVTKKGIIKKTLAKSYINIKNELLALILKNDDELVSVKLLIGDKDIVVYTNKGFGVRYNSSEVKETSRMTIGISGISELGDDEYVEDIEIINDKDKYLFIITDKGLGKKCTLDTFKTMTRLSKPLRLINVSDDDNIRLINSVKGNETFKVYMKSSMEELDLEDVYELPRLSKGKKIINVKKTNPIIAVKKVK